MAQPEAYIADASGLFDASGNLSNDSTKGFLKSFMETFEKWGSECEEIAGGFLCIDIFSHQIA